MIHGIEGWGYMDKRGRVVLANGIHKLRSQALHENQRQHTVVAVRVLAEYDWKRIEALLRDVRDGWDVDYGLRDRAREIVGEYKPCG